MIFSKKIESDRAFYTPNSYLKQLVMHLIQYFTYKRGFSIILVPSKNKRSVCNKFNERPFSKFWSLISKGSNIVNKTVIFYIISSSLASLFTYSNILYIVNITLELCLA
jgi:hypothetical protein